MLEAAASYDELRARFRWRVPQRYNIGVDVCDKWAAAEPERLALIYRRADGGETRTGFGELKRLSNRLANVMPTRSPRATPLAASTLARRFEARIRSRKL